jgi:hypothetical protein
MYYTNFFVNLSLSILYKSVMTYSCYLSNFDFLELYRLAPYCLCMMLSFILQVLALAFDTSNFLLWGSGEWWMLLAAQSMAIGTVMVRWVSKYSNPVMATGWVGCAILHSNFLVIVII